MCNVHLIKKKLVAYQEATVLSYPFLAFMNKDLSCDINLKKTKSSRFKRVSYKQFFSSYTNNFIINVKFPLTVYGFKSAAGLKELSAINSKFIIFKYKNIFLTILYNKNSFSFFSFKSALINIIELLSSYNKIIYYYNAILNK